MPTARTRLPSKTGTSESVAGPPGLLSGVHRQSWAAPGDAVQAAASTNAVARKPMPAF
jgi:hypothetical protein